jgi:hypothetical protein
MEFIFSIGKEILLVPVWALIQSPFLRWGAKLARTANVSLKAAFMLGLITSVASFPIALLFYLLSDLIGEQIAEGLAYVAVIIATVWLYGYFLRNEAGASIGIRRGFIVFSLEVLVLLGALLAVGLFVTLVLTVLR